MLEKYPHSIISCILLCLPALFFNGDCRAQEKLPFKKGTDTSVINSLLRSAQFLSDPDSAIQKLKIAAQKSVDCDFFQGASGALRGIAVRYSDMGKYSEALNYGRQAFAYANKSGSESEVALCHNFIGIQYYIQGNYVPASEEFFKALGGLKNVDTSNIEAVIVIYTNLANISNKLKQKDKTLYYLNKAETLARNGMLTTELGKIYIATVIIDKGNYYTDNHIPDSAVRYYNEVLDIVKNLSAAKANARLYFQAMADVNLGALYLDEGAYEKTIAYSQEAISLARNKYAHIIEDASYTLGSALRHLKKYKEAEAVLVAELKNNAAGRFKDQAIEGYSILADVYRDTKQYKKALDCMDSLAALKDTLVSSEKAEAISRVEAKYNVAEKDKEIAQNELLIAQQKNNITSKNVWIGSISAGVLLLVIVSAGRYRTNRLKQAGIIKSLEQKNTISILKGVVQGEENERIRLARDLHDGIGGMLSAIKMRFMALRHDHKELVQSAKYLEAMGLLDVMGDEIRKTSHNLMPEVLMRQNLAEALRTYCNNIQTGSALHIDFQSFGSYEDIPNDFKLNIYRIIQELLKNVLLHANATYAVVQLMELEAYLTISVEDNGTGFNANETKDGIGLKNLKTRVLSHGGHYTLKSEAGKGTTVYIEFAISATEKNKSQ